MAPGIPAQSPGPAKTRQAPRAPLPAPGVTSRGVVSRTTSAGITPPSSLLQTHAPDQNPPAAYGQCLGRRVFAGCHQSLLGVGPSRHYLRNPCIGAWSPTPQRPFGALAHFFPKDSGLAPGGTSSARTNDRRNATSTTGCFRGCRHSFTFKLPYSLGPQVAPTAVNSGKPDHRAAGPFTPRIARLVTYPEMWYRYVSDTSN